MTESHLATFQTLTQGSLTMNTKQRYCLDFFVAKIKLDREYPDRNAVSSAIRQARKNGYTICRKHWVCGKRAIEITDNQTVQRYIEIPSK